jgi:hypothetical protein
MKEMRNVNEGMKKWLATLHLNILSFAFLITHFSLLILFLSCSSTPPEQQAAEAAKACYDLLVEDDAVRFLECKAGIDSLSADYGEQLLEAVRQYQRDIQQKHGGLREVRISDDQSAFNTSQLSTLILCYSDSTQEAIVVPMVERDGQWVMK